MKVLIVCSHNSGKISPFILEQVDSLNKIGVVTEYFLIKGKGAVGYLKNLPKLRREINRFDPDLIHAHYGLSGLLSCLQRKKPVVTTFHGSDVHQSKNLKLSKQAFRLSSKAIFVSDKLMEIAGATEFNIPCGVDVSIFVPHEKYSAKKQLGFKQEEKLVLFPANKNNPIKNFELAERAIKTINEELDIPLKLVELNNFTRKEVALLMNASEFVLLTSFNEGSPQVIKESMACNAQIVSTKVGAVPEMLSDVNGGYLADFELENVVEQIRKCLSEIDTGLINNGREVVLDKQLDLSSIAEKVKHVYLQALAKTRR
jgi:glycosyltransferase involved in cell wall biosynthesis